MVAATCLSAAFGSILMGAYARYPIALAPGMGLNAYFTYTVVKGMGIPWQTALGAVFLSGVAFLILTLTGLRQMIIAAIPAELYSAVAAGVGLFIALIGFRNAGIIVPDPATTVDAGQSARSAYAAGDFRSAADRRAAGLARARRHADRHSRDHAARRGGGARAVEPAVVQLF